VSAAVLAEVAATGADAAWAAHAAELTARASEPWLRGRGELPLPGVDWL
jgi:hypothetical protein